MEISGGGSDRKVPKFFFRDKTFPTSEKLPRIRVPNNNLKACFKSFIFKQFSADRGKDNFQSLSPSIRDYENCGLINRSISVLAPGNL